tara:strand:+ start:348 stop:668 length:321 start_codon:yes stop_codon:yes gene_type:complete
MKNENKNNKNNNNKNPFPIYEYDGKVTLRKKYFNKSDIQNEKYTQFYMLDYLITEYISGNEKCDQYILHLIHEFKIELKIQRISPKYIHNYNLTESDIELINNRTL